MKTYTAEELKVVLSRHSAYLRGEAGGERANLRGADLRGAHLRGANLRDANLQRADLEGAGLRGADLEGAPLRGANLEGADLRGAGLRGANLRGANLQYANLRDANLFGAPFQYANLRGADLEGARLPEFQLPSGSLVAWKKVREGVVLELEVPAGAKRTASLVGSKCRAEFARVVRAFGAPEGATEFVSLHDPKFAYRVGEAVRPDAYDDDIRVECARGIHFFLTRGEAESYD